MSISIHMLAEEREPKPYTHHPDYTHTSQTHRHTTVCHCIVIHRNKFLLLRRSPTDSQGRTRWLPGWGCEPGENPYETIHRELAEEAGLHSSTPSYIQSYILRYPSEQKNKHPQRLFHTFVQQQESEPTIRLNHEHTDHAWVPLSYINDVDTMKRNYVIIPGLHQTLQNMYHRLSDYIE